MARTTCLYCELEGTTTPLVGAGGGMACPVHSAQWVKANAPPTFASVLEAYGIAPQLINVGRPKAGGMYDET